MKRRAFSLLLSLAMLLSLLIPGTAVYAEDDSDQSGLTLSKTAAANGDGSYTITLEAYANGSKTISTVTQDIPTDIILVQDQSGSMDDPMGQTVFGAYTGDNARNSVLFDRRHNGGSSNLWFKLEDGTYASVYASVSTEDDYTPITNGRNNSTWGNSFNYYSHQSDLFAKVDGEWHGVSISEGPVGRDYVYTYRLWNGVVIATSTGAWSTPTFTGIDDGVLYLRNQDSSKTTYAYYYVDAKGSVHQIGTSVGAYTSFGTTLYRRSITGGGGKKLDAIKTAAKAFADSVAAKAAGTDGNTINHRIAVVGFASQSGYGNNTELLSIRGNNSSNGMGIAYNSIKDQHLKDVLQSMDTQAGKDMVTRAINAQSANGATRVDLGLDMAKRILEANPVPAGEKRNRVVIVFTDGSPTDSNGFEVAVANRTISLAQQIKNMGATVYAVGAFAGADASTRGKEPSGDIMSSGSSLTAACNWFMHSISSNNGVTRTPGYYLSAADAGSLAQIFQQIADQIESGGSSSTLTGESVVRDVISPQFSLPSGATAADIELETYSCTGVDTSGKYTWKKNPDAMGAAATVDGDRINVTGFQFSDNYVGAIMQNGAVTGYRGSKLVIRFKVVVKEGFLGGNNVPTNAYAGVYENKDAEFPVKYFERPTVNVPIQPLYMSDEEEKVYLRGNLTRAELLYNTETRVGNVELQVDQPENNYGLEPWQTEYVDIAVVILDAEGNEITGDFADLREDVQYSVRFTVSPKSKAEPESLGIPALKQVASDIEHILVFKPELTYKDAEGYYGETAAADFAGSLVSAVWKHGELVSTDKNVLMIGQEPALDIAYTADSTKLENGKYTKQDVPVAVTVSIDNLNIGEYTTFEHQDCDPKCGWAASNVPGNPAFLVHIKTCALTVTKTGGAENEPYIFDVLKDGIKYSEVTIWGNGSETLYELPVGTYTIAEKTPWSWRYTPAYSAAAALTPAVPEGTLTCTNTKTINTWLNGFSAVHRNIYRPEN